MHEIYGYSVLVDDRELFFEERVTAQWAVFFNTLGVTFARVPESFGHVGLPPDFWLPQAELWAIVTANPRQLTTRERVDCETLVKTTGHGCLLLLGQPEYKPYSIIYEHPLDIVANDGLTVLKTLKLPLDKTCFQYDDHLLSITRGRWHQCEPDYSFISEHDAEWYPEDMDFHLHHARFSDLQDAVDASQQGTLIQTLTRL